MFKKYSIEIQWAVIFVLMMLVWMVLERWFGLHDTYIDKHMIYTNFVAIPAIAVYVLALLDKKKNFFGGQMTYKQGFISGLVITIVVTILSPLTQYITSEFISPNYFANVISYSINNGKMTLIEAEAYFNLKNYIFQTLMFTPVMGIVTTAIVAFFTKSKNK
jgi:hypothetical protein